MQSFNVFFDFDGLKPEHKIRGFTLDFTPEVEGRSTLERAILDDTRRFSKAALPTVHILDILILPRPVPVQPKHTLPDRLRNIEPKLELGKRDVVEYIVNMQNLRPDEGLVLFIARRGGQKLDQPGPASRVARKRNKVHPVTLQEYQRHHHNLTNEVQELKMSLERVQEGQDKAREEIHLLRRELGAVQDRMREPDLGLKHG